MISLGWLTVRSIVNNNKPYGNILNQRETDEENLHMLPIFSVRRAKDIKTNKFDTSVKNHMSKQLVDFKILQSFFVFFNKTEMIKK